MTRINLCCNIFGLVIVFVLLCSMKALTQKQFEDKLSTKNIHYNTYFKIVGKYKNCRTKIEVSTPYGNCLVSPYSLLEGNNKPSIQSAINPVHFFINQAREVHGDTYNYNQVIEYTNNRVKLPIKCKNHGTFYQAPNEHLSGQGCPKCNKGGWINRLDNWLNTNGESATFYILKCFSDSEEFLKVGITTSTICDRYRKDMPYEYQVLHSTTSTSKKLIYEIEQKVLNSFKKFVYLPRKEFGGHTECFQITALKQILSHV